MPTPIVLFANRRNVEGTNVHAPVSSATHSKARAIVSGPPVQPTMYAASRNAAYIVGWTGGPETIALALEWVALLIGAWTFVPSTLRRLAKGKIGVGTLMTIAAVGAVILGEVGGSAMLAVLFSISEGLEEYAVSRTRRGLRALLKLVPDHATGVRHGPTTVVAEPGGRRLHHGRIPKLGGRAVAAGWAIWKGGPRTLS